MADKPIDPTHEAAKKALEAMNKPKAPKAAKKAAKAPKAGIAPESDPMGAPQKPSPHIKTEVTNEMAGPDEDMSPNDADDLMKEAEKVAAPKKKGKAAPSVKEDSEAPPAPPAKPKAARRSKAPVKSAPPEIAPGAEAEPALEPMPHDIHEHARSLKADARARGEYPPVEPPPVREASAMDAVRNLNRRGTLGAPEPAIVPEENPFHMLERDLPRGGGGGAGGGGGRLPPESNAPMPHEEGPAPGGMGGPLTVAALAAHMLLDPTPTSVAPGEDDIYAAKGVKLPQRMKPNMGPQHGMSPEVAADFLQASKQGKMRPADPKNILPSKFQKDDEDFANAYAEELRRNFPDQISK